MSIVERVKANPAVSTLLATALILGAVSGTVMGLDRIDVLIMTQLEHDADVVQMSEKITETQTSINELKDWNRCSRLESRMTSLEERLWRAQQDETPDPDNLRDIQNDYNRIERQFRALDCARVLAG